MTICLTGEFLLITLGSSPSGYTLEILRPEQILIDGSEIEYRNMTEHFRYFKIAKNEFPLITSSNNTNGKQKFLITCNLSFQTQQIISFPFKLRQQKKPFNNENHIKSFKRIFPSCFSLPSCKFSLKLKIKKSLK